MSSHRIGNHGLNAEDWVFPEAPPEVQTGIVGRVWSTVSGMIWRAPQIQAQEPLPESFQALDLNGDFQGSVLVVPLAPKGGNPLVELLAPPQLRSGDCDDEKYNGPPVTRQFIKDALRSGDNRKIYLNRKHFPVETYEKAGELAKEIFQACNKNEKKFRAISEIFNQRVQIDLRRHISGKTKTLLGEKLKGYNLFLREQDTKEMSIWFNTNLPHEVVVRGKGTLSWATREEDLDLIEFPPHQFKAKGTYNLKDAMIYYKSEITPVN